ncbi:hypothetical protein HDU93_009439 [Gonapodya sp. JEL0774]|nr:hypothetical protein HDU93_009439 [Gonapodya sp. JEL0774]
MADSNGKKFVNHASTVVLDSLKGMCMLNPGLALLEDHKVIYRASLSNLSVRNSQVQLISGGGSGHEPAHAGYVGDGMLSAAVCGDVFASPSSVAVLAAINKCAGDKGVLLLVKNYTGDRLQFSMALSQARAQGIQVDMVVIGDDAAISAKGKEFAGRRGLAGTVLVHKIVGSWARKGLPLSILARLASHLANHLLTLSASLSSISLPGSPPTFSIPPTSYELGLGIHGEPGALTLPMEGCKEIVKRIVEGLVGVESTGMEYCEVKEGDDCVVVVNNLGGVSGLEMGVVVKEVVEALTAFKISPTRLLSAPLMTSLDMRGISVTLLRLPRADEKPPLEVMETGFEYSKESVLSSLEESVGATGWPGGVSSTLREVPASGQAMERAEVKEWSSGGSDDKGKKLADAALDDKSKYQSELNTLDAQSGDGDTGTTLSAGAQALIAADEVGGLDYGDPAVCFGEIQRVLASSMGGTMGALIGVWVGAVGEFLRQGKDRVREENEGVWDNLTGKAWGEAVQIATKNLTAVSGAKYGGRTLLDALSPFASTLVFSGDVDVAARSAKMGAKMTADIEQATHGRSSYVGKSLKGHMDPGAVAVWRITEAIAEQTEKWYNEEKLRKQQQMMGAGSMSGMQQFMGQGAKEKKIVFG